MAQWKNHLTKIWLAAITVISVISGILFIFLNVKDGKLALIKLSSKLDLVLLLLFIVINAGIWLGFFLLRRSARLKSWFAEEFIQQKGIFVLFLFLSETLLAAAIFFVWAGLTGHPERLLRILPVLVWTFLVSLVSLIVLIYLSILKRKTLFEKFKIKIFDLLIVATTIFYAIIISNLYQTNLSTCIIALVFKDTNAALRYAPLLEKISFGLIAIICINVIALVAYLMHWIKIWQERADVLVANDQLKEDNRDQKTKFRNNKISGIRNKFEELNQSIDKIPQVITKVFSQRKWQVLFWCGFGVLTILGLTIRYLSLPNLNRDLLHFLFKWYDSIIVNGGFAALKETSFSNYPPSYLFLLAITTYFPWIPKIIAIKMISIIFDYLLAFAVYKIVRHYTSSWVGWIAFLLVSLTPVVWVNSAFWGQCDSIYTSFLLFTIYFLIKKKPILGLIFFSIALSFKLQSIFLFPFLVALFISERYEWKYLFVIPMMYYVLALPFIIAGQSFITLLGIYVHQMGMVSYLSMNSPNLFGYFNYNPNTQFGVIGYILLLIFFISIIYIAIKKPGIYKDKMIIVLAFTSLLITPFLMPKMVERYFYPAAVASLLLLFVTPRIWIVPLLTNLITWFSFFPFIFEMQIIVLPIPWLSFFMFITVVIWLFFFFKLTWGENINPYELTSKGQVLEN